MDIHPYSNPFRHRTAGDVARRRAVPQVDLRCDIHDCGGSPTVSEECSTSNGSLLWNPGAWQGVTVDIGTRDTTDYCGPLRYHNGSLDRRVTPTGYVKADTAYYFITDHQGNVRQVVRGADGKVVQEAHYYPYGGLFGESSATVLEVVNGIGENDRLFGGKERTALRDLQFLNFEARLYDPQLRMFWTCDPMMEKYYQYSYRLYCLANPANLTDPTGCIVVAKTEDAQTMIKNTLPKDAEAYVSFDENGILDGLTLSGYANEGGSQNFRNLLYMATDLSRTVEAHLNQNYSYLSPDGQIYEYTMELDQDTPMPKDNVLLCKTGEWGTMGHTNFPDLQSEYANSPNSNIQVFVNPELSYEGRAQTFSHEFYGNAYLYMISGGCRPAAIHLPINNYDVNSLLRVKITNAIQETIKNMSK